MRKTLFCTLAVVFAISCSETTPTKSIPPVDDMAEAVYKSISEQDFESYYSLVLLKEDYMNAIESSTFTDSVKTEYSHQIDALWSRVDETNHARESFDAIISSSASVGIDWAVTALDSVAQSENQAGEFRDLFEKVVDLRLFLSSEGVNYTLSIDDVVLTSRGWLMSDDPSLGAH